MSVETTSKRRADRLQIVADTIRLMKDAPKGSDKNIGWRNLNLAKLDSERQIDGFSMALWLSGPTMAEEKAHRGGCRTIGCIAGTTATLFREEAKDPNPEWLGIVEVAESMLGLDKETADTLFWGPPSEETDLAEITREQAARACEKTAAGCKPEDIWSHIETVD